MWLRARFKIFREVGRQVLAELPAGDRARLGAVPILAAGRPARRDLARGCKPTDRGYFYGTGAGERDGTGLPPETASGVIVCFLLNVEPFSAAAAAHLLRHELGHALGQEEADLVWDDLATGADAW